MSGAATATGAARIVAGIGFSSEATAEEIADLLQGCLHDAGIGAADVVAVPAFKSGAPIVGILPGLLGLDVDLIEDADMAAVADRCLSHSTAAKAATGHGSVAEACALAAAGPTAQLIGPRIASAHATCALAICREIP
ncbi:cobalamin biosynthesis protein [Rhodobium gokarnense]|uniref:Cobalt-precorrin 5A hydrolase n=1 Tax=Rhodobium gokarnense TaxID=364296 RepID=A0ABT3H6M0_9HYPH|nr:cobalamin biosynthesis protein [Rhodobium gokarnense]MCW2306036.1 cobalt-precorrin 5A hydrolase [Rhodobium gokarnense]